MVSPARGGDTAVALEAALAHLPSLPRPILARLVTRMIDRIDEIDGDADCDEDDAEDAFGFSALARGTMADAGPGCRVTDPDAAVEDDPEGFDPEEDVGVDDLGCDEDTDMEREQMTDDIPMLPVVSAAYDVFTDQRLLLGLSNLQTSFRSNGSPVRSADSGRSHESTGWSREPGIPV